MDFMKLASERFSVRSFKNTPLAQKDLDYIIEAGRVAPTAHNNQPQKILVIQNEQALKKLRKCTMCHFGAPAALLVCYDAGECWVRSYDSKTSGDIDASIVTTHMMLAAAEIGVGSTWVMHFIPEAVREEFELPDNYEPTALLVLGYPADNASPSPAHKNNRPVSETVFYNEFK